MKKNAVQYIKSLCLSAVAFVATSAAFAAEKLYVYNWTDYVPSNLVAEFTKETGIEVIYSTFESNEEMYAKLKLTSSTGSGYDLVFPSSYYVNKMAKEGMLQELDHSKLSNFKQIPANLLNKEFDPNNKYSLPYVYGLTGMAEGEFAVQDLTWEIVNKMNLGVELGFLNGMIDLQLDYFDERRKDIFMPRESVPMTAGFMKQPWKNFGKVTNQGVEVSLNVNKQFGKDLFVSLMGTFTYAHNEITEKDEPSAVVGTNRAETGHPVGQLTGYIAEGLFTADDFEDVSTGKLKEGIPTQSFVGKLRPGDIRYRDVNGDGKVDVFDKSPIGGTKDPEIVYGFGLNMKYKNLDFGALFQGIGRSWNILGSSIIPGANRGVTGNMFTNANDRWTVDNPSQNVFYPRLDDGINSNNNQSSTWWLRNMSFLRLKNIELGYSLPKNLWRNTTVISGIRLFVRGTNLLTFSKFDLWDPEVENTTGAAYPIMKSLSAGFEIKF